MLPQERSLRTQIAIWLPSQEVPRVDKFTETKLWLGLPKAGAQVRSQCLVETVPLDQLERALRAVVAKGKFKCASH